MRGEADLAERYAALRAQLNAVHAALIPELPRPLLLAAAEALDLKTAAGEVEYSRPDQIAVCTDLVLYGMPEGRQLLFRSLGQHAGLDPALRAALAEARYALVQIDAAGVAERDPPLVSAHDLRTMAPLRLADAQLSRPEMAGAQLGAHLVETPELVMTTGVAVIMDPELARRAAARRDLVGASLAATVARSQWSLQPARPSRSAPCSCGSGRPYRRCHGRRRRR